MQAPRRRLIVELDSGVPAEIARWLWILADTRELTLEVIEGIDESHLDRSAPGGNTIGTILAHLAAIEASWLYDEIHVTDYPPEVVASLPPRVRDADGRLYAVPGTSLAHHLHTLDVVRQRLMQTVREMTVDDLRRERHLPLYDVTPDWVLHHLVQHEAEHRAEIALARTVLESSPR